MVHDRLAALAGATGFVGRRLAKRLVDEGWRVRALVRPKSDQAALAGEGIDIIPGDLADLGALRALVDGADVSINCAGLTKAASLAAYLAVNRDGAARFAQAGGGRVLLVSSLAAREPHLSDYAFSKRAGEESSRAVAGDRLTVLRPPAIYGPGDLEILRLFRLAKLSPIAPLLSGPDSRLALAHVDDVVTAIIYLMEHPHRGESYAVGGQRPEGYGWDEITRAAWRAMGRESRPIVLPSWAVSAAAVVSEALGAASGSPSIFNRGKAREMAHKDWSVSAAEQIPGAPAASFTLEEGFADTVAWYRSKGWL